MSSRSSLYKISEDDSLFAGEEEEEEDGVPAGEPCTARNDKKKNSRKQNENNRKNKDKDAVVEPELDKNGVTRISKEADTDTLLIDLDNLQRRLNAFDGQSGLKVVDANANPLLSKSASSGNDGGGGVYAPEKGPRRRGVATPLKSSSNNSASSTTSATACRAGADAPPPPPPPPSSSTPCAQPKYTDAQLNDPIFRQRLQALYRGFVSDPSEDYVDQQFRRVPIRNGIPWRGICLSLFLLGSGVALLGTLFTGLMGYIEDFNRKERVVPLTILGLMTFIPGSYHSYIILMAAMGVRGYSWEDIPEFD